jgi:hypothetical protein
VKGDERFVIRNNTYKAVRVLSEDYNLLYLVWCNNEHELYDLMVRLTTAEPETRLQRQFTVQQLTD